MFTKLSSLIESDMLYCHLILGTICVKRKLSDQSFILRSVMLGRGRQTLGASHGFPNRHLTMFGSAEMQAKILAYFMLLILLRNRQSEQRQHISVQFGGSGNENIYEIMRIPTYQDMAQSRSVLDT